MQRTKSQTATKVSPKYSISYPRLSRSPRDKHHLQNSRSCRSLARHQSSSPPSILASLHSPRRSFPIQLKEHESILLSTSTLQHRISHTVHYYIPVSRHTSILAMPRNNTSAISALVLIPIAIIILAIFLALKLSHLVKYVRRLSKTIWDNQNRQSTRLRRSNIPSSQLHVKGWLDLESSVWSEAEFELDTFIGQPRKAYSDSDIKCPLDRTPDTLCRRWRRARSACPVWSTTTRARYASPYSIVPVILRHSYPDGFDCS
jgi:hypothetical protein